MASACKAGYLFSGLFCSSRFCPLPQEISVRSPNFLKDARSPAWPTSQTSPQTLPPPPHTPHIFQNSRTGQGFKAITDSSHGAEKPDIKVFSPNPSKCSFAP